MVRQLEQEFEDKTFLRVYPYPLFGTYMGHEGCDNGTTLRQLFDLLHSYGLLKKTDLLPVSYRRNRCFACNANSFVININGLVIS